MLALRKIVAKSVGAMISHGTGLRARAANMFLIPLFDALRRAADVKARLARIAARVIEHRVVARGRSKLDDVDREPCVLVAHPFRLRAEERQSAFHVLLVAAFH